MSGDQNLRVPLDPAFFTQRQTRRPRSPHNTEEGLPDQDQFVFPSHRNYFVIRYYGSLKARFESNWNFKKRFDETRFGTTSGKN